MLEPYKKKHCDYCNKELLWTDKTYEGRCFTCLRKQTIRIAKDVESFEDTELILHLLDIARVHYTRTAVVILE